jgi:cystathionine beta-lyase family protein involved in aluminum resistance
MQLENNGIKASLPLETQAELAEQRARASFARIERVAAANQRKVIRAMQRAKVSESHFAGSTGYGYGDRGREILDEVFANVFGAEAALVRHQITTGTQAIGLCLFSVLRPGDVLVSLTGKPYDSLDDLIGIRAAGEPRPISRSYMKSMRSPSPERCADGEDVGSLRDFGVQYREVPLTPSGKIDYAAARGALCPQAKAVKAVLIQRSRGYTWRDALRVSEIAEAAAFVKKLCPNAAVIVDNCYGEFTEEAEPAEAGADLIAGSLIKNPGGGIAPTGGYVAGKAELVRKAAFRLTAPGLGGEVGATLGVARLLFQGFFLAPHVVGESLKGAVFCAALMEAEGCAVSPGVDAVRSDINQAVRLGSEERLVAFCQGIQKGSAVDSFIMPEPWLMPGYSHPVVMAAGAFVQGSSIELSADGPIKPPYIAYMQGGLVYESAKMGCVAALENLRKI